MGSGRCAAAFVFTCDADSPPTSTTTGIRVNLVDASAATIATATIPTASYTFACRDAPGAPDLTVAVAASGTVIQGRALGPGTSLTASNRGTGAAAGTVGSLDPPNGYMIDLVLSTDTTVPPGFATYAPNWHEDVLLRGGRASNTADLAAGASEAYPTDSASIPADTPPGTYYLCAQVDPADEVEESDETNNVNCVPITVVEASIIPSGLIWVTLAAIVLGGLLAIWFRSRSRS